MFIAFGLNPPSLLEYYAVRHVIRAHHFAPYMLLFGCAFFGGAGSLLCLLFVCRSHLTMDHMLLACGMQCRVVQLACNPECN